MEARQARAQTSGELRETRDRLHRARRPRPGHPLAMTLRRAQPS
jgi:hypothetical protein